MALISPAIRTEGGLLPADLLARIHARDKDLPGLKPEDYRLPSGITINEAINRSWSWLQSLWQKSAALREQALAGTHLTAETRRAWLEPLFQELGFGTLERSSAVTIEGDEYAISHRAGSVPIHLIGFGLDLDRKTAGAAHAARANPHGLLQDFLNRSDGHLWGIIANGLRLRLLRDHFSLTRQAYVEFDLADIFESGSYPDFATLWMVCHQTRFTGEDPKGWLIEQWTAIASQIGTRALDQLRSGVERAINHLGTGFLAHPANGDLMRRLHDGSLAKADYYRQLLRLIYRLIFVFVAEDRVVDGQSLLLAPGASRDAADRYLQHYATRHLRERALKLAGTAHGDGWQHLTLLFRLLGRDEGCPELALPCLGSFLFSATACPDLDGAQLANSHLYLALRALGEVKDEGSHLRRRVDFRLLGAEELGSVYEALLELVPDIEHGQFTLRTAAGNERKTTGSYYTPTSLITCLLDSALDPILNEACAKGTPEEQEAALLALTVCDPACGSGHFLVAAAHRIAKRLASVRCGDTEPPPKELHHALRQVIARCIYGVDLNPLSVELCKVSLWLEGMEPGTPLAFLDAHIKCGNSLIGATPQAIAEGIPDGAYRPLVGDDPQMVKDLKKINSKQRKDLTPQQSSLFASLPDLAADAAHIDRLRQGDDGTLAGIRATAQAMVALEAGEQQSKQRWAADAWVAAFLYEKSEDAPGITTATVRTLLSDGPRGLLAETPEVIRRITVLYRPFHWHVEFPQVLSPDGDGGFSVMLGNPPWDKSQAEEVPFFTSTRPDIAALIGDARKDAICLLESSDPALWRRWVDYKRGSDGFNNFIKECSLFPLCGQGKLNLYAVFTELALRISSLAGRIGMIVQSDIATSSSCKRFYQHICDKSMIHSFHDFINSELLFPGLHRSNPRFCLLTLNRSGHQGFATYSFWNTNASHLSDISRQVRLSADDIRLLSPDDRICPIPRSPRDLVLLMHIAHRGTSFGSQGANAWEPTPKRMFNKTDDAGLFVSANDKNDAQMVPVYEGKMVWLYDHRWDDEADSVPDQSQRLPNSPCRARLFVSRNLVSRKLDLLWREPWLIGWREVTQPTNERTVIACIVPWAGAVHTFHQIFLRSNIDLSPCLVANLSSIVVDYFARQIIGGSHLTHGYLKQLPVLMPGEFNEMCQFLGKSIREWITPRFIELACTSDDMRPLCEKFTGSQHSFHYNNQRRADLQGEIDALFFHLYKINKSDVESIIDSFPVLMRKEESRYGEFRTKRIVLDCYDRMATAIQSGQPYQTLLNPPPADPRCAHGAPAAAPSRFASLDAGLAAAILALLPVDDRLNRDYLQVAAAILVRPQIGQGILDAAVCSRLQAIAPANVAMPALIAGIQTVQERLVMDRGLTRAANLAERGPSWAALAAQHPSPWAADDLREVLTVTADLLASARAASRNPAQATALRELGPLMSVA